MIFFSRKDYISFLKGRRQSYVHSHLHFALNLECSGSIKIDFNCSNMLSQVSVVAHVSIIYKTRVSVRHWSSLANDYDTFERTSSRIGEGVPTKI